MKRCLIPAAAAAVLACSTLADAQTHSFDTAQGAFSRGGERMLNPQPLPPKSLQGTGNPGDIYMLNPQPLPPKNYQVKPTDAFPTGPIQPKRTKASKKGTANPGDIYMLNPQPLPPKETQGTRTPGSIYMLNPQPLPPRLR